MLFSREAISWGSPQYPYRRGGRKVSSPNKMLWIVKKKKMSHVTAQKRAGLLLSGAKGFMMLKCPSAASTAGKPESLVRRSNMC